VFDFDALSRFCRAVRDRPFGRAGSPDLENADKEDAVDDLKAEQDGGAGWNDKPHRVRVGERTESFCAPGAERVDGKAEPTQQQNCSNDDPRFQSDDRHQRAEPRVGRYDPFPHAVDFGKDPERHRLKADDDRPASENPSPAPRQTPPRRPLLDPGLC